MSDNNNRLDVTTWFFDFVERSRGYFNTQEYQMLKDVVETVNELTAWIQGVEADNDTLRKEIQRLREERDDARMLFCEFVAQDHREGYVDHPNPNPQDIAKEMEWDGLTFDGWEDVKTTQYWCDDCGDAIEKGNEFFYAELPCDIASANRGESATVCRKCDKRIEADCCNAKHRTSH